MAAKGKVQSKKSAKKAAPSAKSKPKASNASIQKYLAENLNNSGGATAFNGNSTPPELLLKIYNYLEDDEKTSEILCNLALVCKSFYNVFTNSGLWEASLAQPNYVLLQNTVKSNIWDSHSLNEWYRDIITDEMHYVLPSEIWLHRGLLTLLLDQLSGMLVCAPSREDFEPYSNDPVLAHMLIDCMPTSDCFAYISPELRRTENITLSVIKRFPDAIIHCHSSLLNDRDFVKKVVATNGNCLEFLGDYRQDSELVISAARSSPKVLHLATGQAKRDLDIVYIEMARRPPAGSNPKRPRLTSGTSYMSLARR